MKLLLGALLLGGVCWLQATMAFQTIANFNLQRVAGNWYPLANIVIEKMFPQYTLTVTPKGLTYSFKYLDKRKCKEKKFQFSQVGSPGKYSTKSPTVIQVLDTDYQTYIISFIVRGMDTFLTLAGKEHTMSSGLETKFKEFATSVGVTGDVVPVTPLATC